MGELYDSVDSSLRTVFYTNFAVEIPFTIVGKEGMFDYKGQRKEVFVRMIKIRKIVQNSPNVLKV